MRRHGWRGPLFVGLCDCHDLCTCPGEEPCEHDSYYFEDDGTKVCEDCYGVLDEA